MDNFTNQNFIKDLKIANIEWIRYFIVLAELKNFSKAAKHLNITQQALSKAISGIEQQLGIRLIDRNTKDNSLTEAGVIFLEKSKHVIQAVYDINSFFYEYNSTVPKGKITIGWEGFWGSYVLPKVLYDFMNKYQEVYPKVFMMSYENIENKLCNGQIEIGLLTKQPQRKEIDFIKKKSVPYVIVGNSKIKKNWNELEYIVPGFFFGTEISSDFWDDTKYPRKIIAQIDSIQSCISLCEMGKGNIFVPEIMVKNKLIKGELYITADPPFTLSHDIFISWNKNIYQTLAVKEFLKMLDKSIKEFFYESFS